MFITITNIILMIVLIELLVKFIIKVYIKRKGKLNKKETLFLKHQLKYIKGFPKVEILEDGDYK